MRILVCGGRDYDDRETVDKVLSIVHDWEDYGPNFDVIIHGAARGADSLAAEWAAKYRVRAEAYPANWDEHGKAAGPIRNQQMLNTGIDVVVAFPGGRGTADMVARSRKAGVLVLEVTP